MNYSNVVEGKFISRSNRFIAKVMTGNRVETCHVKNTGRLRELLKENTTVFLKKGLNPNRKTAYSIIGAEKGKLLKRMVLPNFLMRQQNVV